MTEFSLPAGTSMPTVHDWPLVMHHGHVVLRSFHRRDAAGYDLVRAANALWTGPWDATLPPEADAAEQFSYAAWIRRVGRQARGLEVLPFAIGWVDDVDASPREMTRSRIIGQVSVSSIMLGAARSASVGYWVAEGFAGRGIAPVSVALVVDYLFHVVRLHRVEICVRPENAPSLRVVDKLGLRHEGRRARFLHINGDWRDHECFAVCADDVPGGLLNRLLERHPEINLTGSQLRVTSM